ncbi:MAG: undecaprenyl/decaprenyl-phosphate alpha-N-acetylglucosaminyl 1-phosphate transferase [Planctomycetia bacterium]|nr:MAG: undecaprenyl/decaprenyl-phosphate alpha-N-acetylglucosaminyl 1-phosphate transferase [Planctomycetia bacterium]
MTTVQTAALLGGAMFAALVLAFAFTVAMRRIALRIGFVDRPGGHKSHQRVTPYGGGVAIFLAMAAPLGAAMLAVWLTPTDSVAARFGGLAADHWEGLRSGLPQAVVVLLGAVAIHLLGLCDDVRPLGPYLKLFLLTAILGVVVVEGPVRMALFAGEFGSIAITLAWLIVMTNAMNFMDNMDGLSAGVTAICLVFLAVCGLLAGQLHVPLLASVFLGAVLGFLLLNFPPAKVFMGDSGSLLCGYLLGVSSVLTTFHDAHAGSPPYALLMPLVILAVPLYDFASVVLIRIAEGRNPMRGDQRHFSHRLVEHGLSRRSAVLTIYLATAATGVSATLLPGANLRQTICVGVLTLMILAIIAILESPPRRDT